jgi:EVE domain-containing protein
MEDAMTDPNFVILYDKDPSASTAFYADVPGRAPVGASPMAPAPIRQNWIAVASADHVRRGRAAGFMQVCHGKAAPLRRVHPGDRVAYYSPTTQFGGAEKCQAFTSFGIVCDRQPYRPAAEGDFCPYRRDVTWLATRDAPIGPLLDALAFSAGRRNWGYVFRYGLFRVAEDDMRTIAHAMGLNHLPD